MCVCVRACFVFFIHVSHEISCLLFKSLIYLAFYILPFSVAYSALYVLRGNEIRCRALKYAEQATNFVDEQIFIGGTHLAGYPSARARYIDLTASR